MQEALIKQPDNVVVSDPTQKIKISLWIIFSAILVLDAGSIFVTLSGGNDLVGSKSFYVTEFLLLPLILLLLLLMLSPFLNMPGSSRWKHLERKRQEAVKRHVADEFVPLFPLPEMPEPSPANLAIRVHRDWLVTALVSLFYLPLLGLILGLFILDWESNMQYLAIHSEMSTGMLFSTLFGGIGNFLFTLPIIVILAFATQQQIITTSDALVCQRGLHFRYIPWHQARLFAVIEKRKDVIVYELSSGTNLIRWSNKPAGGFLSTLPAATIGVAPFGLVRAPTSNEEYQKRIRELTVAVSARTALPLYDLCLNLKREV